ncbi:hypothetical protein CBR_g38942 [Chara braunii]|uniref:DUF4283 domain-containing protein n=1 Tax=Chara braunii TaxID=69332 RepID=A0A388K0P0_CHABU|nr:hypothetical protein CBR_g38942 [Chara braunii]|eukprot:GBG63631.1 hypothetical protein CBR_g38942 [Chara braunii]
MVGAEEVAGTPGLPRPRMGEEEEDANKNRSPPPAHTNYWPEEEPIRKMLANCYKVGILPSGWDIGELKEEGTKAHFTLKPSLDEIKVKWLKERTVTIIFQEGSKNLPKKIKEDVIRAFEDIWLGEHRFDPSISRGRVRIESSNVLSYVAKDKNVAEWMLEEMSMRVALKRRWYNIAFKPWMTKVEIQEARREEANDYFWIRVIDVPIHAYCYLESAAEMSIGAIRKVYPSKKEARTPQLINVHMNIAIECLPRLKETLSFTTFQGQEIEFQVTNALTPWCSKCQKYFHLADVANVENTFTQRISARVPDVEDHQVLLEAQAVKATVPEAVPPTIQLQVKAAHSHPKGVRPIMARLIMTPPRGTNDASRLPPQIDKGVSRHPTRGSWDLQDQHPTELNHKTLINQALRIPTKRKSNIYVGPSGGYGDQRGDGSRPREPKDAGNC